MAQRGPQIMVLTGLATLLLAMTASEGTWPILPGLVLMTWGGLWDARRSRGVNFGNAELRQPRT